MKPFMRSACCSAGANGYIMKPGGQRSVPGLGTACPGRGIYVSEAVGTNMIQKFAAAALHLGESHRPPEQRELQILHHDRKA